MSSTPTLAEENLKKQAKEKSENNEEEPSKESMDGSNQEENLSSTENEKEEEPSKESMDGSNQEETTQEQQELEEELVELNEEESDLFDDVDELEESEESENQEEEKETIEKSESNEIGKAFSDGVATMCTIGLEEDERDEYKEQFQDLFSEFKVDHFAQRTVEEKVLTDVDDELDPTWALVGALVGASIICLAQRPDANEQFGKLKSKVIENGDS